MLVFTALDSTECSSLSAQTHILCSQPLRSASQGRPHSSSHSRQSCSGVRTALGSEGRATAARAEQRVQGDRHGCRGDELLGGCCVCCAFERTCGCGNTTAVGAGVLVGRRLPLSLHLHCLNQELDCFLSSMLTSAICLSPALKMYHPHSFLCRLSPVLTNTSLAVSRMRQPLPSAHLEPSREA